MDSKVVSKQIEKECIAREPTLEKYLALVRSMENHFKGFMCSTLNEAKTPKLMM
jgi:hypothetical protein